MDKGNPLCLITISVNKLATEIAVNDDGKVPKWAALNNLSTTTNMIMAPLDIGSPVMKSIDKFSHT